MVIKMIKYECWLYSQKLEGWVLTPDNVLYSNILSIEDVESYYQSIYPTKLLQIESLTVKEENQLRLF